MKDFKQLDSETLDTIEGGGYITSIIAGGTAGFWLGGPPGLVAGALIGAGLEYAL